MVPEGTPQQAAGPFNDAGAGTLQR
ncbi:MAG: hypothetical protein K0S72_1631, partial [Arthrobacter sp.]|nr:hypothetical protein [Arthrobacter sp.]